MSSENFPPAMRKLVNELSKLPSIGAKSAGRLAYHLLIREEKNCFDLAQAINEARAKTKLCNLCFALTEDEVCEVCEDQNRLRKVVCIVEKPIDVIAIEKSGIYRGLYHVLHGLWSPMRGAGPEQAKMKELFERIEVSKTNCFPIEELVLATSATVEGDATAMYIAESVSNFNLKITRIAQGMPQGGELEYADMITLSHAFEGRRSL
jgi:recombination protein RecR